MRENLIEMNNDYIQKILKKVYKLSDEELRELYFEYCSRVQKKSTLYYFDYCFKEIELWYDDEVLKKKFVCKDVLAFQRLLNRMERLPNEQLIEDDISFFDRQAFKESEVIIFNRDNKEKQREKLWINYEIDKMWDNYRLEKMDDGSLENNLIFMEANVNKVSANDLHDYYEQRKIKTVLEHLEELADVDKNIPEQHKYSLLALMTIVMVGDQLHKKDREKVFQKIIDGKNLG